MTDENGRTRRRALFESDQEQDGKTNEKNNFHDADNSDDDDYDNDDDEDDDIEDNYVIMNDNEDNDDSQKDVEIFEDDVDDKNDDMDSGSEAEDDEEIVFNFKSSKPKIKEQLSKKQLTSSNRTTKRQADETSEEVLEPDESDEVDVSGSGEQNNNDFNKQSSSDSESDSKIETSRRKRKITHVSNGKNDNEHVIRKKSKKETKSSQQKLEVLSTDQGKSAKLKKKKGVEGAKPEESIVRKSKETIDSEDGNEESDAEDSDGEQDEEDEDSSVELQEEGMLNGQLNWPQLK